MGVKDIIKEIENLPDEGKAEVYSYIGSKLQSERKKTIMAVFEKLKGRGKNILNLEAQSFINTLRTDDRG